ncbi:MAG: ComEC/Rec2 family competence protein [bacterium]
MLSAVSKAWGEVSRSPSRWLLALLLAWLVGLGLRSVLVGQFGWVRVGLGLAVGLVLALLLSAQGRRFLLPLLLLTVVAAGFWRYDLAWRGSAFAQPAVELPERGEFVGTVVAEPRERVDGLAVLEVEAVLVGADQPERARLYLKTPLHYRRGDRLSWSCRPRPVVPAEATGFDRRLLLDGVRSTCSVYGEPEVLAVGRSSGVSGWLAGVRRAMVRGVGRVLPEPESSFLLGLLIGQRDGLPEELTEGFRQAGLTHILAVSGYNVSQLIGVGTMLLGLVLLPRRKSVLVMSAAVVAFAALVGGDPSVVRAAMMGCVGLLAVLLRRHYDGLRAILLAAAVMLLFNPLALRYDVGFQLSFAAVWGLHGLAPGLLELLPERWRRMALARTAIETTSATLATLPIMLHVFGRLPAVVLLANLLVLPLLPWAMLFGVLALVAGAFSPALGQVPGVIAAWLLRTVEWLALGSVQLVPQALELTAGSWTMVALYFWLGLLAWLLHKRSRILCRGG